MRVTKYSINSILNSVLLLALISFVFFSYSENKKSDVVYLDNVVVFSEFNMSKDLQKLHEGELLNQRKKVDSLVAVLQNNTENNPNNPAQGAFVLENKKLKEMGAYFSNEVSQQVWSRLNEYIKEYGKKNNYKIVLGTQGNGNIMFAEDVLNITNTFLEFANKKYEGE